MALPADRLRRGRRRDFFQNWSDAKISLFALFPHFFIVFLIFGTFFTSGPAVCYNAAADRPVTTHLRGAPGAHYDRTGQPGVRRTVREIDSFLQNFGRGWSSFVLTFLRWQKATSLRGSQGQIFLYIFHSYSTKFIIMNHRYSAPEPGALVMRTRARASRGTFCMDLGVLANCKKPPA